MEEKKISKCELCDEPMPPGEEMFRYHGYSCDCPKDAILRKNRDQNIDKVLKDEHL